MGASHGLNRAVEPLYRGRGLDAVALPLSEQLDQPLPTAGRTILVASQSGESAEVVRWLGEARPDSDAFGLTLDGTSTLARSLPSLIGAGGGLIFKGSGFYCTDYRDSGKSSNSGGSTSKSS